MPHALLYRDDQAVAAITGVLEESVTCERPLTSLAAQMLNAQSFDLVLVDCEICRGQADL